MSVTSPLVIRPFVVPLVFATLGSLPVFLTTAQAVYIGADLDFAERELGLAVGGFFGAAALASAIIGPLVDRFGQKRSSIIAAALSVMCTGGIAIGADSTGRLILLLIIGGIANAGLQASANVALATSIMYRRQGLAFGVKQSAIPISVLIGGATVPTLGSSMGWRATYGLTAVMTFVVVVAIVLGRRGEAQPAPQDTAKRERPPTVPLVMIGCAATLGSASAYSLGSFLPTWAFKAGMSAGETGLLLSSGGLLCVAARLAYGVAADRRGQRNLPVVALQLSLGALGFLLLTNPTVPFLVTGVLLGFIFGWSWPGLLIFAMVRVARDSPGMASGAVQSGGFAGGALGPPMFGLMTTWTSYPSAWLLAATLSGLAAVLVMGARGLFLADLARRPL